MSFKVLLAPADSPQSNPRYFDDLPYPLLLSPKIDGIRGVIKEGKAKSRKYENLRSYQVQDEFTSIEHLDGEFAVGAPFAHNVYNLCQSHIMAFDKPGHVGFHVFDYTHPDWLLKPFYQRLEERDRLTAACTNDLINFSGYFNVPHDPVENIDELLEAEARYLEMGYEGVMLRDPMGIYKNGRGTYRQGIIFKLKREEDIEVEISGYIERMRAVSGKTVGAMGQAKISKAAENLEPAGTLGKFKAIYKGREISVAPGQFDHNQLQEIWDNRDKYLGKTLKCRHFPHGAKDELRQCRALGFRDKMDF